MKMVIELPAIDKNGNAKKNANQLIRFWIVFENGGMICFSTIFSTWSTLMRYIDLFVYFHFPNMRFDPVDLNT